MADLQEFAENVWIIDGPQVRDMSFMFTTRMTVVRLSDGSLWVDSPVPASFDTLERIRALGPVRYLVAATPRHVWRLDSWHTLFPQAQLWVGRRTLLTLQKGPLPLSGVLGGEPPAIWAADLDQVVFKGNPLADELVFFHRKGRTIILDDLIQTNWGMQGEPLRNAVLKLEGVLYPRIGVGLEIRLTYFNRKLARQALARILAWDFDRLIIAHGPCIESDAKAFVRQAFSWLAR